MVGHRHTDTHAQRERERERETSEVRVECVAFTGLAAPHCEVGAVSHDGFEIGSFLQLPQDQEFVV